MSYENDQEMNTLKIIAETLNRSNDLEQMLQTVLEKLLELTKLETGWIFLVGDKPHYRFVADVRLPPALTWEGKKPMCTGSCSCLNRYWKGDLVDPINIIECKRLDDALQYDWGETKGITHHATVPLAAGEERFGILNVASPGKEHFTKEELTLLQSVAYQIGTAVKRTRLFHAQQKRAESFANLNEVTRLIWKASTITSLTDVVVQKSKEKFPWSNIGFYTKDGSGLQLRSSSSYLFPNPLPDHIPLEEVNEITSCFQQQKPLLTNLHSHIIEGYSSIAAPITMKDEHIGVLFAATSDPEALSESDLEVLQALTAHISLAFESIRLQEQRGEILLYEERKRLARDLHDSVNQKLFSLSLLARGAREVISKDFPSLTEPLEEMLSLSQGSLKEMRSLIWQLRPVGVEEGLVTAIHKYAEHLGLTVNFDVSDVPDFPRTIEEALWRIAQESLNNVSKHANVQFVNVTLQEDENGVTMIIRDTGKGFERLSRETGKRSLGLTSMKERAELIGGSLQVESRSGGGTRVKVILPWNKKENVHED
ncbi:GAF domain-containing sensor histidine kinase [Halobacillus mangrovi]|uniref:GAF domain-containing sensor histidine kinase n=1 Tax=Halobacillus mangrovi TaxID=402384 RepID=UPI003D970CB0